jgi:hypothetical protein
MKKGFILLAVMTILFLMGLEFYILNGTSSGLAIETNRYFLSSDKKNLISSGLELAKLKKFKAGQEIELDTQGLAWERAKMSIKVENPKEVEISIRCWRGGQEIKSTNMYHID